MSVNIKTASGLKKLSGDNLTKDSISLALGYTPANPDEVAANLSKHTSDTLVHVSADEKSHWNDKSYNSLTDKPNLVDDGSGEFIISDNSGNIAFKVDAEGVTHAADIVLNGENVGTLIEENTAAITTHDGNTVKHITDEERAHWNDKSYNSLTDKPNFVDDGSGEFIVVDSGGKIALKVDAEGVTHAADIVLNGENVKSLIEENSAAITQHDGNTVKHITSAERTHWNNKSYNSLTDKPNILDDGSNEFVITDSSNKIAFKVSGSGVTQVAALEINGADVVEEFDRVDASIASHKNNNSNPHSVTKAQVGLGNVDNTSDTNKPISTAQKVEFDRLDERIDDVIASTQSHASNSDIHIQPNEREYWNDKSYHSLTDKPSIVDDGSSEFVITDKLNQIALKVDESGTTSVADLDVLNGDIDISAGTLKIQGIDIITTISEKADELTATISEHTTKTDNPHKVTAAHLGLENVTNTSDADKPVSIAQKIYIDNAVDTLEQADEAISAALTAHTTRTDNPHSVTKSQIGLSNVDNTSDVNKPVSTAQKAAHDVIDGRIDELADELTNHDANIVKHITADERAFWNDKSYNSLTDKPAIIDDESNEFNIVDSKNQIALKVDSTGKVLVKDLQIDTVNVLEKFDAVDADITNIINGGITVDNASYADHAGYAYDSDHTSEADHAQEADFATDADHATEADNAAHAEEADHASAADSSTEADHANSADYASSAGHSSTADSATHADYSLHADSAGDALTAEYLMTARTVTFVGAVDGSFTFDGSEDVEVDMMLNPHTHDTQNINGLDDTLQAIDEHIEDTTQHVTSTERDAWNDKSWTSITGRPDIIEDNSKELVIADDAGAYAFKVDEQGATHVAALNINGQAAAVDYIDYDANLKFDTTEIVI